MYVGHFNSLPSSPRACNVRQARVTISNTSASISGAGVVAVLVLPLGENELKGGRGEGGGYMYLLESRCHRCALLCCGGECTSSDCSLPATVKDDPPFCRCYTIRLLLLTGSIFSDFAFQMSFCGHGRTFIDTWPMPHHSSDLCVISSRNK